VTLHASDTALPLFGPQPEAAAASRIVPLQAGDYDKEWLTLDMNVHVVESLTEALEHIRRHGTAHSEAILTGNMDAAARFEREVDASSIYVNASTRFTDGGQFGLGAEVAISTQKLHARGPMGLDSLTTYKWIARGDYAVRG
jgi:glutamate-5-semialdehyde dehydrogenase